MIAITVMYLIHKNQPIWLGPVALSLCRQHEVQTLVRNVLINKVQESNLELFKLYIASRGNVPALVLADQIHKAPAPGSKTVSKYPKVYHNQEGLGDTATKTFDAKELYGATALFEYPVMRRDKKPFEFETKKNSVESDQL